MMSTVLSAVSEEVLGDEHGGKSRLSTVLLVEVDGLLGMVFICLSQERP